MTDPVSRDPRVSARFDLQTLLAGRPRWMNALFLFCLYMTFVYMPYDFLVKPLFSPVAEAEEVWFGIMLRGWAAKGTEPLHWVIYAAGAYGFWRMSRWMWPWAALYVAQIAVGMLVWSVRDGAEGLLGWAVGLIAFAGFGALTVVLWRARDLFSGPRTAG